MFANSGPMSAMWCVSMKKYDSNGRPFTAHHLYALKAPGSTDTKPHMDSIAARGKIQIQNIMYAQKLAVIRTLVQHVGYLVLKVLRGFNNVEEVRVADCDFACGAGQKFI